MKALTIILSLLLILTISCKKEKSEPIAIPALDNTGFKAQIIIANTVTKSWKTTSANAKQANPVAGVDYFAIRGGINPDELTLISFGKLTDDPSGNPGRLTIFLSNVTDTGTYEIGGTSTNSAVLTVLNGSNLEHYSTDQNNKGSVVVSKYNISNNMISGTFAFQSVSQGNVVRVENGSFTDVPFKQ